MFLIFITIQRIVNPIMSLINARKFNVLLFLFMSTQIALAEYSYDSPHDGYLKINRGPRLMHPINQETVTGKQQINPICV